MYYDLIIVDSANPFGVNESLFTREFYGSCYNALKPQGVLISQHANAFYAEDEEAFNHIRKRLTSVFENNYVYMASIPTYAAGYLLFGYSCKSGHPLLDLQKEVWESLAIPTQFYNVALHQGAFALPNYIKELL